PYPRDQIREKHMQRSAFVFRAASVALLVLVLDESLKTVARTRLSVCSEHLATCDRLDLVGSLALVRTGNAGSAFGFGQGMWVWLLLAILGVLLIPVYARSLGTRGWLGALAVGLQLGGAVGNVGDRVLFGGA